MMYAEKLLLHLVLKSENRRARTFFTRTELAHFVGQFSADSPPIEPCILALQTIELAGAATDLCRAAFGREGHDRSGFSDDRTAAHLRGGVRGH